MLRQGVYGLALVDVRVLDHFVVTNSQAVSMAELGLL
jgi:DNA repair protein RadC